MKKILVLSLFVALNVNAKSEAKTKTVKDKTRVVANDSVKFDCAKDFSSDLYKHVAVTSEGMQFDRHEAHWYIKNADIATIDSGNLVVQTVKEIKTKAQVEGTEMETAFSSVSVFNRAEKSLLLTVILDGKSFLQNERFENCK